MRGAVGADGTGHPQGACPLLAAGAESQPRHHAVLPPTLPLHLPGRRVPVALPHSADPQGHGPGSTCNGPVALRGNGGWGGRGGRLPKCPSPPPESRKLQRGWGRSIKKPHPPLPIPPPWAEGRQAANPAGAWILGPAVRRPESAQDSPGGPAPSPPAGMLWGAPPLPTPANPGSLPERRSVLCFRRRPGTVMAAGGRSRDHQQTGRTSLPRT